MRWTDEEKSFVLENYVTMSIKDMAKSLNRTETAIKSYRGRANLPPYTEDDLILRKELGLPAVNNYGKNNPSWIDGRSNNAYHYKKIQIERYPERVAARNKVAQAIKKGVLQKLPCEICGTSKDVHAHHDDYHFPLMVQWLCRTHHREVHNGLH